MRRVRVLIALLMVVGLLAPAVPAAAAETCGELSGTAFLRLTTPGSGVGHANVLFGGSRQHVTFDETAFGGGTTTQVWHFAEGDVTFFEENDPGFPADLPGPRLAFESTVTVTAGGSSVGLTYAGIFNTRSGTAVYDVTATELCIGS